MRERYTSAREKTSARENYFVHARNCFCAGENCVRGKIIFTARERVMIFCAGEVFRAWENCAWENKVDIC